MTFDITKEKVNQYFNHALRYYTQSYGFTTYTLQYKELGQIICIAYDKDEHYIIINMLNGDSFIGVDIKPKHKLFDYIYNRLCLFKMCY